MRWILGLLVVVSLCGCGGQAQCLLACTGTLSVNFLDGTGAPLTPSSVVVGSTEYSCSGDGGVAATCSGNTMVIRDVLPGLEVRGARAASGAQFTGAQSTTWMTTGDTGGCCTGSRTGSANVTLR